MTADAAATPSSLARDLTDGLLAGPPAALASADARLTSAIDTTGPFPTRWDRGLGECEPDALEAARQALTLHLLFPADITPATKRAVLHAAGARLPDGVTDATLAGVAPTGVASRLRRLSQVAYLLRAAARRPPDPDGDDVLADARACRRWLHAVPAPAAGAQREALAHLLHPGVFEPIASPTLKRRIRQGLAALAPEDLDDDAALRAIRDALRPRFGDGFAFTDPGVRRTWER